MLSGPIRDQIVWKFGKVVGSQVRLFADAQEPWANQLQGSPHVCLRSYRRLFLKQHRLHSGEGSWGRDVTPHRVFKQGLMAGVSRIARPSRSR